MRDVGGIVALHLPNAGKRRGPFSTCRSVLSSLHRPAQGSKSRRFGSCAGIVQAAIANRFESLQAAAWRRRWDPAFACPNPTACALEAGPVPASALPVLAQPVWRALSSLSLARSSLFVPLPFVLSSAASSSSSTTLSQRAASWIAVTHHCGYLSFVDRLIVHGCIDSRYCVCRVRVAARQPFSLPPCETRRIYTPLATPKSTTRETQRTRIWIPFAPSIWV